MSLPTDSGWYVVHKKDVTSPQTLRWYGYVTPSWRRVISWYGPIYISSFQVVTKEELDAATNDSGSKKA